MTTSSATRSSCDANRSSSGADLAHEAELAELDEAAPVGAASGDRYVTGVALPVDGGYLAR